MPKILDQYGNPIKPQDLLEEQAAAKLTGVRTIFSEHTTYGMNPGKLARIIRATDEGDAESYLSMAEELEEKEPHYLSVIGTRKRAVAQLEITVEPASDDKNDVANADLVQELLDRDELEDELFHILDACGKGYSVAEILWDLSEKQWMPAELCWRDQRWFEFDRINGRDLYLREGAERVPLTPYKFIIHTHQAKSGIPIRGGLVRPCSWMWLFKNFSLKDWVIFAEAYGQPIRVGKYGAGASKEDKDTLMRAVANIGSDAAAIIPESMMIQFVEAQNKATTADVFERLSKFCDQQMSKAVLGQTTTTDAISGGHSVSKEHNEVRQDIERSDAKQLAATLNKQLIRPFIDLNRGPQAKYPRLRIGRTEDVDIEKLANASDKAVRMGIRVSEQKLRNKLGLPEPESDDDVIKVPGAPAAAQAEASSTATAHAAGSAEHDHDGDAIDDLADALAQEWEEVADPILKAIQKAASESASFDEFAQKLLEVADDIPVDGAAERIRQAAFSARIAGNVNAKLED